MNKPLPRSRFGAAFNDGWDRIFGKQLDTNARSHSTSEVVATPLPEDLPAICEGCGRLLHWYDAGGGMWKTRCGGCG